MLYNSDGLPVICMVYKKVYIFYVIVGTFFQYLPYFQNKNTNRKNLQYENNLRFFFLFSVKQKFWFSKNIFPKGLSGKRGVIS